MIKKLVFICCAFLLLSLSYGQTSNALYYMWGVPQSTLLNPAINPSSNFYAGIAGGAQFSSSSLDLNTLAKYNEQIDTTEVFYSTFDGWDQFLGSFENYNAFGLQGLASLNLGFRAGDYYLGFDIIPAKFDAVLSYPGDIFNFIYDNTNKSDYDFSAFGMNMISYTEIATRIAYDYSSDLTIGWRGKILFGLANMSTAGTKLTGEVSTFQWAFPFETQLRFASPALNPIEDFGESENVSDNLDFEGKSNIGVSDVLSNLGLGMDIGANYKYNDKLQFAASLVDIGYIRWKNGYTLKQNGTVYIDPINNDSIENGEYLDAVLDTFQNELTIDYQQESYTTALPAKVYLSARYLLHPKIGVGLVSRSLIFNKSIQQSFTASTNFYPLKGFSFSLSYSYLNRNFQNLGMGLMISPLSPPLRLLPLDFFFIVDNLPLVYAKDVNSGIPVPHKMRGVTFMAGMNMRFGINKNRNQHKDQPLYYY